MIFRRKHKGRLTQAAGLRALRARGVEIASVIDVGVQRQTASLIECFPDAPHLLIEPVSAFYADIARNYKSLRHEIVAAAASDENGVGRLATSAIAGEGVTHAHVGEAGEDVALRRLDSLLPKEAFPAPYLLKIDVDSTEASMKALAGAAGIMGGVHCIVCEMIATHFVALAAQIEAAGFALWDIVDVTYYDDVLYQCDAVFVRRASLATNGKLKPFSAASFDPKKWRVLRD